MIDSGPAPRDSEVRAERGQRTAIASEHVNAELTRLLRRHSYSPEELFGAPAHDQPTKYARDRAEENMRLMLALALEDPTNSGNVMAVGRAALVLLHMAMDATARDRIERGAP